MITDNNNLFLQNFCVQICSEGSVTATMVKAAIVTCRVRDPVCTAIKRPLAALYKYLSAPNSYAYGPIQINLSLSQFWSITNKDN